MQYPKEIGQLIESFSKLPGIGNKTATRLAFFVLNMDNNDVKEFSSALTKSKEDVTFCSICGNITSRDMNPCAICSDSSRDQTTIFVVEDSQAVMAIENTNDYHGLYHVLNGVINPMQGIGPNDINMASLLSRLKNHPEVDEVIAGLDATPEGEATSMYMARLIKPSGIKMTTLARGLSMGANLDYADSITLSRAVSGRIEL
ncbi:MAG: recombination mediator RecR [Lactobacillaceae bacterium]|jgi:recombination protein RecR|nr:recombination mediator RecR [Lactobacillaceae bacterium]